jgi:hypothetical protein
MKSFFSKYIIAGSLLLSGMAVGFTSCKKYLDINPVSSFGPDYVFGSVANAESAVLGAYACLGGDQGYGIRLSMYYTYDNDEMIGQTGNPDNERRDIAHYNTQPSNTQLANPFNQIFRGIERANICIYSIPQMDQYNNGSASDKAKLRQLYGEALALRAQYYFEAIRNWGDLPAQFQPSSLESDLFKPKTDRDTIYNRVLADLAEAATIIPWRSTAGITNERFTQGAVRALRARIALFRGGYSLRAKSSSYGGVMARPADYKTYYQIAKDECTAIIAQEGAEHQLNPSYKSVFKDALGARLVDANAEILWEVGMSGGSSNFGDSKLGYYNGPRYNGTGNSALLVLPTYFYSFDTLDVRRDVMCAPYNINQNMTLAPTALTSMFDGKFRRDWNPITTSAAQYFGTNWPVIRYSDVLLMFAEADNEMSNGPTAAAKAAFEKVRLRAFNGNVAQIGTTPSDYAGFFDAIMKERSWELGGEGIRKYDLIRWNKLGDRLAETKLQLQAMAARTAPYDQLPATMYFLNNQTSLVWLGSFYKPTVTPVPPSTYGSVAWVGTGINTAIVASYAQFFVKNKKELFPLPQAVIDVNPNITQNDY